MVSLKGKTVFITGSSLGIGKETAFKFAQEGCRAIITYFQDQKEAEKVVKRCQELGAEDTLVLPLNIMEDQSIKDAVKKAVDKFGALDILINNAGVFISGSLESISFKDIEDQVRTNLEGLIKLTKECLPYIRQAIINIGSGAALRGSFGYAAYSASKFGVRGFAQSLAEELPYIKVYIVNPGPTATRMASFSGQAPEEVAQVILNTVNGKYHLSSGSDVNVWEVS